MDDLYCRKCGNPLAADAAFCQRCGAALQPPMTRSGSVNSALVIVALILFFPIGLYLMWAHSDWDADVKWGISGLLLPPLWTRFLWRARWPLAIKVLLAAALLALVEVVDVEVFGIAGSGPAAILIINILVTFLVARSVMNVRSEHGDLRAIIESKLDTCHQLIAEVEAGGEMELLPAGSSLRRRYIQALEMRSEGMSLFEGAQSRPDLVAADARISRALDELRATRMAALSDPA